MYKLTVRYVSKQMQSLHHNIKPLSPYYGITKRIISNRTRINFAE